MDAPLQQPAVQKSGNQAIGPIAAIIIVVILFAIGGVYVFMQEKERMNRPPVIEVENV